MAVTSTLKLVNLFPEYQSNFYTTGDQLAPDVITLNNGAEFLAYINGSTDHGSVLVENSASNGLGAYQTPSSGSTDAAGGPSLAKLANGNALVVWDENVAGNAGIRAAIYQENAIPVKVGLKLTAGDDGSYAEVDAAGLKNGNFVVSYDHAGGIHAQIFKPNGAKSGVELNVSTSSGGTASDSQVTALSDGAFAVTWTETAAGHTSVHGRVFNANGSPRTADLVMADTGDASQASVEALADGRFAMVYTDAGWSEGGTLGNGISLEIFSGATGLTQTGYIHVNTSSLVDEVDPDVTVLENGFIVVSWTKPFSATDHDIMGRVFDSAGNPVTIDGKSTEFVITNSSTMDVKSAIAARFGGSFETVWQDSETDGSGGEIKTVTKDIVRVTVGDASNDSYTGDLLSDSINGGSGQDTLVGGAGKDTIEGSLDGDSLYGDEGDDELYSNTKASKDGSVIGDTLDGGAGNDYLYGSKGNDSIDGGSGTDLVSSGAGSDTVYGGDDYDFLYAGDASNATGKGDLINGGDGGDHIFGSAGVDTMLGGEGDDVFGLWFQGLNAAGDIFNGGNGTDRIEATYDANLVKAKISSIETIDFHYGSDIDIVIAAKHIGAGIASDAHIENDAYGSSLQINMLGETALDLSQMVFEYSFDSDFKYADVTIVGDGDAEQIIGSMAKDTVRAGDGNDTITGGLDIDRLQGGKGDDLYIVDHQGEAQEKLDQGTDTVKSNVTYALNQGLENLTLVGNGDISGTGNGEDNVIIGNNDDNVLAGKAGNDTLNGGLGDDRFVFNATLDGAKNVDTIVKFIVADDTIRLDDAVFQGLDKGFLAALEFRIAPAAVDIDDHIIYNSATGNLYFDIDGNGGQGQVSFALLSPNLALTAADFVVF